MGLDLNDGSVLSLNLSRNGKKVPACLAFSLALDLPAIAKDLGAFLHRNEIDYYQVLKFPLRRTSFLLGRHAAKKAVAAFLEESDPSRIEICIGTFNQPIVNYGSSERPELTIAHCQDAAVAIAFQSGHPMGVDLEYIEADRSQVLETQFTPSELERLKLMPEVQKDAYYLLWTVKEALSKTLKCGLTVPISILEVEQIVQDDVHAYTCLFRNFAQYQARSWIQSRHVLSIVLPKNTHVMVNPFATVQFGLLANAG